MTWEQLDASHPGLVEALGSHPGIGLLRAGEGDVPAG
jgi:hypothetical protein